MSKIKTVRTFKDKGTMRPKMAKLQNAAQNGKRYDAAQNVKIKMVQSGPLQQNICSVGYIPPLYAAQNTRIQSRLISGGISPKFPPLFANSALPYQFFYGVGEGDLP